MIDLMTAIALQHFTLEFSESSKKLITWKNRALLISLQQQRSGKPTHTHTAQQKAGKQEERKARERERETMGARRVGKSTLVSNPRLSLNGRSRPLVISLCGGNRRFRYPRQTPNYLRLGQGLCPNDSVQARSQFRCWVSTTYWETWFFGDLDSNREERILLSHQW